MYTSSIYSQFSGAEKPHAFRQDLVFHGEHTGRQRIGGVAFQHGHALLQNDAAVIDLLIHKMSRCAGYLCAVSQHSLVDMMSIHALSLIHI